MDKNLIKKIYSEYDLSGEIQNAIPFGNGRINTTYKLVMSTGTSYILQMINNYVFKDIDGLMNNIEQVSEHIYKKTNGLKTLKIIKTKNNKNYIKHDENFYRIYENINSKDNKKNNKKINLKIIEQAGIGFGEFQNFLSDFDALKLVETIPNFHNTKLRLADFIVAYKNCKNQERKSNSQILYNLILNRKNLASENLDKLKKGILLKRVTHNDPKLDNVVFDDDGNYLAVIDLDTVMPGLVSDDFGDAVRFCCNDASEDETDFSKVLFNKSNFDAFCRGFLSVTKNSLTKNEIDSLATGCLQMTYELAIRFLTDYLNGDVYFKVSKKNSDENLTRANVQMALFLDMEKNLDFMNQTIKKYASK